MHLPPNTCKIPSLSIAHSELQRSTSSLPHTPPKSSAMDNEISEECAAATVAKSQNLDEQQQQQQPRMAIQRDPNACGAVIPPATVTSGSPRMQSPACRAAAREIPTPPSTPPRAPVQCPSNTPGKTQRRFPLLQRRPQLFFICTRYGHALFFLWLLLQIFTACSFNGLLSPPAVDTPSLRFNAACRY